MPFLFIIIYILIEIGLFSVIGSQIGTLPMLLLVVGGFFLGSYFIRTSGQNLRATLSAANQGLATAQMTGAFARFFAGLLLILPGFFTDIIGMALLFEPSRAMLMKLLKIKTLKPFSKDTRPHDDIIEGVIINDNSDTTLANTAQFDRDNQNMRKGKNG